MQGRIKRGDLDHLLRLVQTGLPQRTGSHEAGGDADAWLRARGNLAPDHALWNANHAYWIDKLKNDTGGTWTDSEYAAAASIINAAEYQHVIFSDIASALTRGLSRGLDAYADFGEPSLARYAVGAEPWAASGFEETIDLVDATTGQAHHVRLAAILDDVRRSDLVGEHRGETADATVDLTPGAEMPAPDIALSSKLVNLGVLTGGRARNGGPVSFNEVRGDLFAQSGLTTLLPYADWDDFRERNHLSDDLIADLKAAYPEGFAAVDLWVGGLAEHPAVGALGPTIAATLSVEISQMKNGAVQYHLDLLAGTHLASVINAQTWSDIVARNMDALQFADFAQRGPEHVLGHSGHYSIFGTDGDDILIGTDGSDILYGGAGDDLLDGGKGADVLIGGDGNDTYVVDNIMDRIIETPDGGDADTIHTVLNAFALDDAVPAGVTDASSEQVTPDVLDASVISSEAEPVAASSGEEDPLVDLDLSEFGRATYVENLTYIGDSDFIGRGNSANNVLIGGPEDDMLWGREGDDVLIGNEGDDALFGGSGNDILLGGYGDDWFESGSGDDVLYVASHPEFQSEDEALSDEYGGDTIVLRPGFGNDVVFGFDAENCSAGRDRLDVSAYTSLNADSIGTEIQIVASGSHTIITISGDSIMLLGVNASTIGKDDFIFG